MQTNHTADLKWMDSEQINDIYASNPKFP